MKRKTKGDEVTIHPPLNTRHWVCLFLSGLIVLSQYSCQSDQQANPVYRYGTESDSALYYFNQGWHEIMDNGRWTKSEEAFRRAVEYDPDWLLGKSLVGRITRDLQEREQILADIRANQKRADKDERMLLDVNLFSLEATNNMARGRPIPPELSKVRQELAERNFGAFARKYPEDSYFKAEYIEFLNRQYGANVALDTLRALATPQQRKLGFYIGYEAQLELDQGNLDKAIALSQELDPLMLDETYLTKKVLQTRILLEQDSVEAAKKIIDQVILTDPNHLIAVSLRRQVLSRLK